MNTPEPTPVLRDPCGVGVVDDRDGRPGRLDEAFHHRIADPLRVDVAGGLGRPIQGDHREPHADRRVPVQATRLHQALHDSPDGGEHGVRRGWLRRRHPDARRPKPAGLHVHDGRLDPAAAHVDADRDPPVGHRRTVLRHQK